MTELQQRMLATRVHAHHTRPISRLQVMSSGGQSRAMADKLLAKTSDLMSTLRVVQKELEAWSAQATGSEPLSHRSRLTERRAAHRKDTLAELRRTVEVSKKRINGVCNQSLKNIKVAEEKRNQSPDRSGQCCCRKECCSGSSYSYSSSVL